MPAWQVGRVSVGEELYGGEGVPGWPVGSGEWGKLLGFAPLVSMEVWTAMYFRTRLLIISTFVSFPFSATKLSHC